jgi:hypothetical protein
MPKIDSTRQWGTAFVCFVLGVILIALSLLVMIADAAATPQRPTFFLGLILAYLFLGGVVYLFNRARCLKSRGAGELRLAELRNDSRALVFYLRPLKVDNDVSGSGARVFNPLNPFSWGKLRRWRGILAGYRSYLSLHWTIEQVMEFATRKVGPLVAIGRPGSPPVLGAYNVFDDRWQERVAELAHRAQLVVLVAGAITPGLLWEAGFITRTRIVDPSKFVIFVPGGRLRWWWPFWRIGSRKRNWATFRKASAAVFPVPLPEKLGGAAFLGFAPDWKPFLLDPTRRPPITQPREYVTYRVMAII